MLVLDKLGLSLTAIVLECYVKKQNCIKLSFLIIHLDIQLLFGLNGCIAFESIERKHSMS